MECNGSYIASHSFKFSLSDLVMTRTFLFIQICVQLGKELGLHIPHSGPVFTKLTFMFSERKLVGILA